MNKIIEKLKAKLNKLFKHDRTGHDILHLERVYENALKIQKEEGGDLYIISVSSLIHDIHRLMSTQQKRYVSPKESLETAKKLLIDCDVDNVKIDQILEVVKSMKIREIKMFQKKHSLFKMRTL